MGSIRYSIPCHTLGPAAIKHLKLEKTSSPPLLCEVKHNNVGERPPRYDCDSCCVAFYLAAAYVLVKLYSILQQHEVLVKLYSFLQQHEVLVELYSKCL